MTDPLDYYFPYKEAVRHLRLIIDAASGLPNNPVAWTKVENSLGAVLNHVLDMITDGAMDYSKEGPLGRLLSGMPSGNKPTIQDMRKVYSLLHDEERIYDQWVRKRALALIENWPKEYKRRRKKAQTEREWHLKALHLLAEMERGMSRATALAKIGQTEATIQKHIGRYRRALEHAGMDIPKPKRNPRVKPRGYH
jgi:hypothetical protein